MIRGEEESEEKERDQNERKGRGERDQNERSMFLSSPFMCHCLPWLHLAGGSPLALVLYSWSEGEFTQLV